MEAQKRQWTQRIKTALEAMARNRDIDPAELADISLVTETPPKPELGDIAVPLFRFAKVFRTSPNALAQEAVSLMEAPDGQAAAAGGYVNIKIDLGNTAGDLFERIRREGAGYGSGSRMAGRRAMVEFSCPNTNKPLHLGHLRNDSLGESVARIFRANGAEVKKVNLINDRGIHICKSMLAYQEFGSGETPESTGVKSDHFVGSYYVKFNQWAKEQPDAEARAQQMLQKWEQGDEAVIDLWKTMNRWAVSGIEETYRRTGISFDDVYYESRTYSRGREEILAGLDHGAFYRDEEGTVWADLSEIGLDRKVLLRKDGTSLYLTQDIGTAILRHGDWPFNVMVYVVGSEQQYHFAVLFHVLKKLGYDWSEHMYHLSYGMVNLPDGRMKSREGTVVDADDLLEELQRMAKQEIVSKGREQEVDDLDLTAERVSLAALNYYLLQVSPSKDMVFDPAKSIEFNGNTGPYLQYMGARLSSMLGKFEAVRAEYEEVDPNWTLMDSTEERELIKLLSEFPAAVEEAGSQMNPAVITSYLYALTKTFSRFYHEHPVLRAEPKELVVARVELCRGMLQVLKNGFQLLAIPFVESM